MDKNNIACGIIKDLLPSYLDGLLSDDVKEAVERHIEECSSCRFALDKLKKEANEEMACRDEKEERFIKKARKINYYMVGFFIGLLIPVLAIVILCVVYFIRLGRM